jgi:membrane protease subunit HflC
MKTNLRMLVLAAIAFVGLLILMDGVYIVNETQQVIITQFGEPVGEPVLAPGIHFKLPFIQKSNYFDKRFLEWDGDANQVPTRDKRFIWVDTYARWRIDDPLKFFQRLNDEEGAQSRLDDILDGETRNAVAKQNLVEVVRSLNRDPDTVALESEEETAILEEIEMGRQAITREILTTAQGRAADLGIEIIDLQFKRINYVDEVRKDVFERMIADEKERDLAQIQSEAYRTAEEIRGKADGEATDIYAQAYNRDVTFYTFMKSLETYEVTADPSSALILTTESDLLRYLKRTP